MKRAWILALARHRSDEGSALILALIIVVAVGIMLSTALTFAGTGLLNGPKIRDLRNQTYYGQGAVDGAINYIRGSSINGTFIGGGSGPCPTFTPTSLASGQNLGADGTNQFQVTCTGLDSGHGPGLNTPLFAIQTLDPSAGMGITTTGNDTLSVDGGVFSANRILVNGGAQNNMAVQGSVLAVGACGPNGRITTTDPAGLKCSQAQTLGGDPHYAPGIASAGALSNLIGATGSGADPSVVCDNSNVAKFSPGYYSELPETLLDDSTDPDCNTQAVWWFQPGYYYFDFTNASGGQTWNVDNVVGGTLPSGATWQNTGDVPWGRACDSTVDPDTTQPTSPGVQFIFGGNSSLTFGDKDAMELCGPSPSQSPGTSQSIALFGLGGTGNVSVQGTSSPDPKTDQVIAASSAPIGGPTALTWLNPENAKTIDGSSVAVGTLLPNADASLSYPAFDDVPFGSSVTKVSLRLARKVTGAGTLSDESFDLNFPADTSPTTVNVPHSCGDSTSPCNIDITDDLPADGINWQQVNGLSLTYNASANNKGAVDTVDGIELVVDYTAPVLEALNGGGTYFVNGSPPNLTMQMHGTVYTPSVGMTIEDHNRGDVIFSRGVIVSNLQVDANPSFTQTDAPFQLPGVTSSRLVLFTGQTRPDSGSPWVSIVQACVKYNDNNSLGSPGPALPGYTLSVKHWTVLRSGTGTGPPCT